MLPIIFVMPIIQLLVLVHAATFEMKDIRLFVVDNDQSSTSRLLISKFKGSSFYKIIGYSNSFSEAEDQLLKGNADVVFAIPQNFEKNLNYEGKEKVQLTENAINGTVAGLINVYSMGIINDFNKELIFKKGTNISAENTQKNIDITYSFWYNPELNYKTFMVPGILVLLVTIIGLMLSGMNIVREKEMGTIEQINVTPIKKYQFITGKLFPFWLIALFELAIGLTVGKLLFHIPIIGNVGYVFLTASVYLLVILGIGLFVSTLADTQQQAMFITFFFMMIFILMSGLFTSVESMPDWAQQINRLNPVAYFIKIIRMILLKGSGLFDFIKEFCSLVTLAIAMLSMSVWRYKKVV